MKYPISILLFTFLINSATGQSDTLIENKFCLMTTPLSLIDCYSGSSIRLGAEIKLHDNLSFYSELGTFLPHSLINSYWFRENSGFLIKEELKYYLNNRKFTSGDYCSIELFYKSQSYTTTDSIKLQPRYSQDYNVSKNVYCATLKFGELTVFKNGLIMDVALGLGARFKFSNSTLTDKENENILGIGDYSTNILANKAGTFVSPNFQVGIKLGYRIK